MKFLKELVKENGHKLVHYDNLSGTIPIKENHLYMSVFSYSSYYGGTFDGFKYYNDYLVDITNGKNINLTEEKNGLRKQIICCR